METYITSRRARIPVFIDRHFSFRGALALHRKTFGRDFYKHLVNLLWGLPVALVQGAAALLEKAGAHRTAQWLHRMPRGMPTVLHKELRWLIYTDLLELPYVHEGRAAHRDALMEHLLAEPWIAALCEAYVTQLHSVADRPASPYLEHHPAFDDLLAVAVGTLDRDEGHGPLLAFGGYQDEAQCDINRSPSPLLEHYPLPRPEAGTFPRR